MAWSLSFPVFAVVWFASTLHVELWAGCQADFPFGLMPELVLTSSRETGRFRKEVSPQANDILDRDRWG
jgi:hypothetical protein